MNQITFTLSLCLCLANSLCAQDAIFTQFRSNPVFLNPALTGNIAHGDTRFVIQYRNQWFDAYPSTSFEHAGVAVDTRLPFCTRGFFTGLGIFAESEDFPYRNEEPAIKFSNIGANAAFHIALNEATGELLSLGFQGALLQKRLKTSGLQFPNQFDGLGAFDPGATTEGGRFEGPLSASKMSLSTGLHYTSVKRSRFGNELYPWFIAGFSIHHLNRPNLSFFDNEADVEADVSTRFGAYGSFYFSDLGSNIYVRYAQQGSAVWQILLGAQFKVPFNKKELQMLSLGPAMRLNNPAFSQQMPTDLIGVVQLEFKKFQLGFSGGFSIAPYASVGNDNSLIIIELVLGYTFDAFEDVDRNCVRCANF